MTDALLQSQRNQKGYSEIMKTTHFLLALLVASMTTTVNAQTFYHCTKNGKKLISDQPCDEQGAKEQKRVNVQDMPPLNTTQSLSAGQVQQSQQIDRRMQQQKIVNTQQMQYDQARQQEAKQNNDKVCADLWRYKEQIIAQQRRMNSDWWNAEHRRVNDDIYKRNCGSN